MNDHRSLPVDSEFILDLYRRYMQDPSSVDESWGPYFSGFDGMNLGRAPWTGGIDRDRTALMLGRLIEAYRWRGHLRAKLDPLGLAKPPDDPDLALDRLALAVGDSEVNATFNGELGLRKASLHHVIKQLDEIYCGTIGFEFMHLPDGAAREWFRAAAETGWGAPSREERRTGAERIIEADELEQFMHRRFVGKKRFGAEGAESMLAWLWAVLARTAERGARTVVIGGTARGRLNTMANIVGKPIHAIFAEFSGARPFPEGIQSSVDVTYHLGFAGEQQFGDARVRIDYCNNPSHLEAVDPVSLGRVRALQARYDDPVRARAEIVGLMVHTDAAFAGQGLVAEVLQLSGLEHYETGGTIHLIINNQLGFTTDSLRGRTSIYCSDVAKTIGAPVLHVNADDVDAVLRAAILAAEFRSRFGKDVIVDLVCYRRRGHNELDEPSFTQPEMYQKIADHPPVRQIFLARLKQDSILSEDEENAVATAYRERLETAYDIAKTYRPNSSDFASRDGRSGKQADAGGVETGLPLERLREIGLMLARTPDGFEISPKIEKVLAERVDALTSGTGINWAGGEALAYGSLIAEGVHVRLSGQDTPRGAFSHRHFILHDQRDGRPFVSFEALPAPRGRCEMIASPLAEYATLGFEYGYSLDAADSLVVWEAQFGDFANVAQVIIDQFISSADDKWLQPSHLTMLLPHGLEGQGPEHSSARIERFLQMCAGGNMTVVNCSTPANYFHVLRRQARGPRRPLVIFTPKSLLRHRFAISKLTDMGPGTKFLPVIGPEASSSPIRRIVLSSGKIYWDLHAERERVGAHDVGLVSLEQLYPFPDEALEKVLRPHAGAEIVWCQEEPQNMGPWSYVDRRIEMVLRRLGSPASWPAYVGRPENPSPAIGTTAEHNADQTRIIQEALNVTR